VSCENSLIRKIARFCKLRKITDEQTYGDARGEEGETWYMASPRNFGESSIDAEREREEREREKEREKG